MMALFSSHLSSSRRSFSVGQLVRSQFGHSKVDGSIYQNEGCVARPMDEYLPCYPMKKSRSHTSVTQASSGHLEGADDSGLAVTSAPENALSAADTDGESEAGNTKCSPDGAECCCQRLGAPHLHHCATSSTVMSSLSGACSPPQPDRPGSKPDMLARNANGDLLLQLPQQPHGRAVQLPSKPSPEPAAAAPEEDDSGASDLMGAFGILTADQWSALRSAVSDGGAPRALERPPPPAADVARYSADAAMAGAGWPADSCRDPQQHPAPPDSLQPQSPQPLHSQRQQAAGHPHNHGQEGQGCGQRRALNGGPCSSCMGADNVAGGSGGCTAVAAAAPQAAGGDVARSGSSTGGSGGGDRPSGGSTSSVASLWAAVTSAAATAVYDSTDDNVLAGQRGLVEHSPRLAPLAIGRSQGHAPVVPHHGPLGPTCRSAASAAGGSQVAGSSPQDSLLTFRHTHHAAPSASSAERYSGVGGGNRDRAAPAPAPAPAPPLGLPSKGAPESPTAELATRSASCFAGSHFAQARSHLLQYGYFSHDPGQSTEPAEFTSRVAEMPRAHFRNSIDVGYYYQPGATQHQQQAVQPAERMQQQQPAQVQQQQPAQVQQQAQPNCTPPQHPIPELPQPQQQPQQQQQQPAYPQPQHRHPHQGHPQVQFSSHVQVQVQPQQHSYSHHYPQPSNLGLCGTARDPPPSSRRTTNLTLASGPASYTTYGYRRARSSLAAMEQGCAPGAHGSGGCGCESHCSSSDDDTEEATRRITAAFRTQTGMARSSGWGLLGPDTAPSTPTWESGRKDPWASAVGSGSSHLPSAIGEVGDGGGAAKDASGDADADDGGGPLTRKRSSYHLTNSHAAVELFLRLNHARQTMDFVKRQTLLFANLDKAELNVWEALHTLDELREYEAVLMAEGGEAQDVASLSLLDHAFQTAELCRLHHPDLDWLHLVGLIHGLGKLLAHRRFGSQPQWAICGETFPLGCRFSPHILGSQYFTANPDRRRRLYNTPTGLYGPGCGLLNVVMSWSAPEYLYLVLMLNCAQLPQDAVWVLRHAKFLTLTRPHSCYLPLCSTDDLRRLPLLRSFQQLAAFKRVELPEGFGLQGEERTAYYSGLIAKYIGEGRLRW